MQTVDEHALTTEVYTVDEPTVNKSFHNAVEYAFSIDEPECTIVDEHGTQNDLPQVNGNGYHNVKWETLVGEVMSQVDAFHEDLWVITQESQDPV